MDAATALFDQLRDLARGARDDNAVLAAIVTALVASLRVAVPTYHSLRLKVIQNGYPVVLSAGEDRQSVPTATTSLRLPLTPIAADCEAGSQIVFYATAPGAFVDLAADLRHALGSAPPEISIDADLPPTDHPSGLSGSAELAAISRAVGVLIERGTHPGRAHDTLRNEAATAGLQPEAYALEVLRKAGPPASSA